MTETKDPPSLTEREITNASVREGALDAAKIGLGESYLSAFGIFLHGSPIQIGILATLPPLLGSICQGFSVWLMDFITSRKRMIVSCVSLQVLVWPLIVLLPFLLSDTWVVNGLILCVILYQLTAGLIAPVWNSWTGDLVSPEGRGRFFGFRNKVISIVTCASMILAGEILNVSKDSTFPLGGFLLIFILAGLFRYLSLSYLRIMPDPPANLGREHKFTFVQFLLRGRKSNFLQFVIYVSSMNFAVSFAGPYFAVYMLRDLQLSYFSYTILLAAQVVAQFLVIQNWGVISDQVGNRRILAICGWQVALNPLFWLLGSNLVYLIFVQIYAGLFWAGFNLAAANFLFDAVTPPKRARCVAYQSIINGVLVFAGSLCSGWLASYHSDSLPLHQGLWTPVSPFISLFVFSACVRLFVVIRLLPAFKEVRPVQNVPYNEIIARVINIREAFSRLKRMIRFK